MQITPAATELHINHSRGVAPLVGVKTAPARADKAAPPVVDPLGRYRHYAKAQAAGELDPAFKTLSVWELRNVVNGDEPDAFLTWGREMLRNSPMALRLLKSSMNAADDGLAGVQQLAGDATLLFYLSEEGQEGRDAYKEKRAPDFGKFPKRP